MGQRHGRLRLLIKEFDKILSAPYAVLLNSLRHALDKVDDTEILLWTVAKPCQIAPFVQRLVESLPSDEVAWPVLLRLVRDKTVRDELIKQDPTILQRFFSRCNESDVSERLRQETLAYPPKQILQVCLALCNHPFDETFALSPEYLQFVTSVLKNTWQEPEPLWLDRVHDLLSTAAPSTLLAIEDDAVQQCIAMWNDASKTNDIKPWVKFMSIGAIVHRNVSLEQPDPNCSMQSSSESKPVLRWAKKCTTLFSIEKSQRVVRSVMLRVLYLISTKSALQDVEVAHYLDNIRQILNTFEPCILKSASQDQEFQQVVIKVAQKSMQECLSVTAQLSVFGILQIADPNHRLWDVSHLHAAFETLVHDLLQPNQYQDSTTMTRLTENTQFLCDHRDLFRGLAKPCFSHEPLLRDHMQRMVDCCRPGTHTTIDTLYQLHSANVLMEMLTHTTMSIQSSGEVARCLVNTEIPAWWDWEISLSKQRTNCRALDVCPHARAVTRQHLMYDMSEAIILSACTFGLPITTQTYHMLRKTPDTGGSELFTQSCTWLSRTEPHNNEVASFHADKSKQLDCTSQVQLIHALSTSNEQVMQLINQHVDGICRDLQLRCQNVEEPLRIERSKLDNMTKQLTEARGSIDVMLADHHARTLSWQNNLDLVQQQNQMLKEHGAEVETELQSLQEELKREAQKAYEAGEANTSLREQHVAIENQLQEEKMVQSQYKHDLVTAIAENEKLQLQLQELQSKEERLLCVLRGGHLVL